MDRVVMRVFLIVAVVAPTCKAAVPGTFFWKPRVGLDLSVPTSSSQAVVVPPTWENINAGKVVLIRGYQAGLTIAALASVAHVLEPLPHLNPGKAYYYTNAYRWALRHLSLIPDWLSGDASYADTHKVWNRRFHYMDYFVPEWMRKVMFFVPEEEWGREEHEWRKFVKYAEPAFGRYYRYPSRVFRDFQSMLAKDTIEDHIDSDASPPLTGVKPTFPPSLHW